MFSAIYGTTEVVPFPVVHNDVVPSRSP
jgi:hypothetical protein